MFLKIKGLRKSEVVENSSCLPIPSLPSMLKQGNVYFHLRNSPCVQSITVLPLFSKTFEDSLMWKEFSLLYNQNIDLGMKVRRHNEKSFKSSNQGL